MVTLLKFFLYPIIGLIILIILFSNGDRCLDVAPHYLNPQKILNDKAIDSGVRILGAQAVKSYDHNSIYFVQYKMITQDNEIIYPMFAMNKPRDNGIIISMNDIAWSLSGLGDRKLFPKLSENDDGYQDAMRCLK